MPTRTTLVAGIVVVLLLSTALGIALAGTDDNAVQDVTTEDPENTTIQMTASDDVSASPDSALVRTAVVATGDTAEEARQQVARNASRMRGALDDEGLADEQVRSTYFDIRAIEPSEDEGEITGYRAIQGFEIELSVSPDAIGNRSGAIVDTAVQNGANQIDGVQFTLSDDRRQELRRAALGGAMETARSEAEHLANVSGVTIGGTESISTGEGGVSPVDVAREDAAGGGGATTFQPGQVTVSATVTVTYRAE